MSVAAELAALRGVTRRLRTTAAPIEVRTAHAWASVLDQAAGKLTREVEHLRAEAEGRLPEVDPEGGYEGLTLDEAAARYASRAAGIAVSGRPAVELLDERRRFVEAATALSAAVRSTTARGVAAASPDTDGAGMAQHAARATAKAAALQALPASGRNRRRVLDAVAAVARQPSIVGLTDLQIASATGLRDNSVRPRRVELVDGGWLMAAVDSEGKPITREHYGREHTVWVLTQRAAGTPDLWASHPGA